MERWTRKIDGHIVFPSKLIGVTVTPDNEIINALLSRLAAYEDTGMEPCDYSVWRASLESEEQARADLREALHEAVRLGTELSEYRALGPLAHLKELVQAEDNGRLVVLPCKPDDVFFQWKKGDNIPSVSRFEGVAISEDGEITYPMTGWGEVFTLDDFGKTVFLTREEAKAALAEKGEDNEH